MLYNAPFEDFDFIIFDAGLTLAQFFEFKLKDTVFFLMSGQYWANTEDVRPALVQRWMTTSSCDSRYVIVSQEVTTPPPPSSRGKNNKKLLDKQSSH